MIPGSLAAERRGEACRIHDAAPDELERPRLPSLTAWPESD